MAENQCQIDVESPKTPGQILFNKYEKGRLLGQGNYGKVYHGKILVTNESVAIKVIKKEQIERDGMMDHIKREISVMRLVRHPNIVEFQEVMATKTKIYIVMEYVKGGELLEKITGGRLKEDEARKYFQQLISAVDFCHSRGVYHRDLKPENLLLDDNGDLKVTDFGLSALHQHRGHDGMLYTQCGTPAYIAPEVVRRRGYDGVKADIWSCGVILFALLAGFLPFQDESRTKMFMKIFKAEYECPPWFSSEAKKLIAKMLIVDPKRRITIPSIMKTPWFRKGFTRPFAFSFQEPGSGGIEMGEHSRGDLDALHAMRSPIMQSPLMKSPPFFNAFEFISSMSSGFDLSAMFHTERKSGSLFTSKMAPNVVIQNLEALANQLNFMVRVKNFKVKMQGKTDGRKGKLLVKAEVYKVAPEVTVVEFSKASGDTLEYNKFCEEDIRPALKDIVWTWQGEENNNCD